MILVYNPNFTHHVIGDFGHIQLTEAEFNALSAAGVKASLPVADVASSLIAKFHQITQDRETCVAHLAEQNDKLQYGNLQRAQINDALHLDPAPQDAP